MLPRVLEPEVMDTEEDAREYEAIPNGEVNAEFVGRVLELAPSSGQVLDMGTGPGHIALLLAERAPHLHVTGIDLAGHMLSLAERLRQGSSVASRVTFTLKDVKETGYPDAAFDFVLSNSLVHHIPDPLEFFREVRRLARPGAGLFIKDLLRPTSREHLEELVRQHASDCNDYQRSLFANSLHAALTLDEVAAFCHRAGLTDVEIRQPSDRHWSIERLTAR